MESAQFDVTWTILPFGVSEPPSMKTDKSMSVVGYFGWILPTGNLSEQIGTLFAGTFAPERIGGNEVDNAQIISDCQNRGARIA
jgi:hypothetical protein